MTRTFQVLAVAALGFAAAATPLAADETQRTAIEVRYAELNLTSDAGAEVLLRRLDRAAKAVCGVDTRQRGLVRRQQRACHAETLNQAVASVDAPMVTQLYAQKQGQQTVFASR